MSGQGRVFSTDGWTVRNRQKMWPAGCLNEAASFSMSPNVVDRQANGADRELKKYTHQSLSLNRAHPRLADRSALTSSCASPTCVRCAFSFPRRLDFAIASNLLPDDLGYIQNRDRYLLRIRGLGPQGPPELSVPRAPLGALGYPVPLCCPVPPGTPHWRQRTEPSRPTGLCRLCFSVCSLCLHDNSLDETSARPT